MPPRPTLAARLFLGSGLLRFFGSGLGTGLFTSSSLSEEEGSSDSSSSSSSLQQHQGAEMLHVGEGVEQAAGRRLLCMQEVAKAE